MIGYPFNSVFYDFDNQINDGDILSSFKNLYFCEDEDYKDSFQENDLQKIINNPPPQNSTTYENKNSEQNSSSTSPQSEKALEPKKEKLINTKLGRKRNGESGTHNKFSFDNMTRKLKPILIDVILKFLNEKITESNPLNLKLAKINQKQATNSSKSFNQNLLNKSLKDIMSENVTKKCTVIIEKYGIDYNKKIIDSIYEENNKNGCYESIVKILDKKLIEVLEHCRDSKYYDELVGLKAKFRKKLENELANESQEYKTEFWNIIKNYEKEYDKIKGRKKRRNVSILKI